MQARWDHYVGVGLIVIGGILLLSIARVLIQLVFVIIGYKLIDAGLYMLGQPTLSYWISWLRAHWRI